MVADVVVENASYSFDIPFSYRVPGRMEGQIRPGCRVLVPFGRSNRSKQGLVLHLQLQDPQSQQLKPIKMLLDQKPLLGEEQLWLLELLHQRTFCTYYEGLRALVPSGLTFRLKLMCSLGEARPQQPTDKQRQLLDYLSAKKKPVELEHLLEQLELERGEADFEQLLEEGAILLTEQATEKIADSKEVMVRKSEDCEQKLEGVRLTPARKRCWHCWSRHPAPPSRSCATTQEPPDRRWIRWKKPDCCATTAGRSFAARMPTGRRRIRHRSPSIPRSSRRWTVCGNSGSGEKAPPCCTV